MKGHPEHGTVGLLAPTDTFLCAPWYETGWDAVVIESLGNCRMSSGRLSRLGSQASCKHAVTMYKRLDANEHEDSALVRSEVKGWAYLRSSTLIYQLPYSV